MLTTGMMYVSVFCPLSAILVQICNNNSSTNNASTSVAQNKLPLVVLMAVQKRREMDAE